MDVKFVENFISSLNTLSPEKAFHNLISSEIFKNQEIFKEELSIKFEIFCKELHFNVANNILAEIINHLQNLIYEKENSLEYTTNTCNLIFIFLQNICLDEIPEKFISNISTNFEQLVKILTRCFKNELKKNSYFVHKYLSLLRTCFELIIILPDESIISQDLLDIENLRNSNSYDDFSFIFPSIKTKLIKIINENIIDNSQLKYEWILLLIDKLRFMLKINEINNLTILEKLFYFILTKLMDDCDKDIKYWLILLNNFHIFYECKLLFNINLYLSIFSRNLNSCLLNENSPQCGYSLNFIINWQQSGFSQMSDLHVEIVKEIFVSLQNCFEYIKLKKRKLKSEEFEINFLDIFIQIKSNNKCQLQKIFVQQLKLKLKNNLHDINKFNSILKISFNILIPYLDHKLKPYIVIIFIILAKCFVPFDQLNIIISMVKSSLEDYKCCSELIQILDTTVLIKWVNYCLDVSQNENKSVFNDCIEIRNTILFCGLRIKGQIQLLDPYFNQIHKKVKNTPTINEMLEMVLLMEQLLKVLHRHYIRIDTKKKKVPTATLR